ncbi:MAG: hypothetical protein J6W95_04695 [Bacteroidales bacterium]|nr:hypothetical protein [Bacteroidales bacterium]
MDRQTILQACIDLQSHVAEVARQEMDSAQQQSNDYGANVDRYDSYRTKMMRARDMYAKQLSNANASLRVLQELQRMPATAVAGHGSVVLTDKQCYLLGIGLGKVLVPYEAAEGQSQTTVYAVSAQTPVYLALKGHGPGESLIIAGQPQTIKEIY